MFRPSERIAIINGERKVSFSDMLQHISIFGRQLPSVRGFKALILSENREGWLYALYSVWSRGGIVVPVDAASTPHDVAYILNDCRPEVVWTSASRRELLDEAIAEAGHTPQILSIDEVEFTLDAESLSQILATADCLPYGDKWQGAESDTALICYTSGTTGSPKGVMLSYTNIMANVHAVWTEVPVFDETRRTIILLPLHHVLPLVGSAVIPMVAGGGVAICPSLAAADIMRTLQEGRIGIMIGVPRLWQTLYRGIKAKIDAKGITRALFNLCDRLQNRSLSRLVFSSVRQKMGGAITYCVAGGAALDAETARGLKTLGLDVLEGYGMTEAAPMITFTRPGDIRPGCVGLAVPSVEVKIVDGELCARGRNVMQGYYNRPEETADIIDAEGWLHTGDLATIDETGHVTITGRKKEIIVLSNGKNVNPSEIEEKIEQYASVVKEAAVTESNDLLCLIAVPKPEWAVGKTTEEMETLIKNEILQPYNAAVAPYKRLMSLHVYMGELPRTRLEKLQRFRLKELLAQIEAGATGATPVAPAEEEVLQGAMGILVQYIKGEKGLKAVHPTDNLETDLAMDSLDKVALQGFIENTFGVRLSTEQLTAFACLGDIVEHIEAHKTHEDVEEIDWHRLLTEPRKDNISLPRLGTLGRLLMGSCRVLMRPFFGPEYVGLQNIPTEGAFILAPNHQSYLDGPLVVGGLPKEQLERTYFYAKRDHVRSLLARTMASQSNVIVMDMNTLSDSIYQISSVLKQGRGLVIFPEGTRTRTGEVGQFKKAFAIMAHELQVPVIPVRITGAYEAWPRTHLLPRPHRVKVEFLPAVRSLANETYEQLADRVRDLVR